MIVLNPKQKRVLDALRKAGRPLTPTSIGQELHYDYDVASQQVQRPLQKLVKHGFVVREARNQRVVTYSLAGGDLPPYALSSNPRAEHIDANVGNILLPPITEPNAKIDRLMERLENPGADI